MSLRGEVRWHFEKDAAESAVRTLTGVVGVTNHVTIAPQVDVVDVGNDIRTALHRSWFFDGDTIKVSVDGGTVQLTGPSIRFMIARSPRRPRGPHRVR